jgi:hypothetical protein
MVAITVLVFILFSLSILVVLVALDLVVVLGEGRKPSVFGERPI